ncbi:hypothetical protein AnaeK_1543 [Anaeromyxobacter sp. K]|uniref:DUF4145 domain-containing protein n=1 Tax=Anaeromyxobacter sp. (strain K) TaxID=447217 RepID=UPI00017BE340|nr:DUF4145 domain-containing protein [Anaeromyxobacter sp. K]ACG72772.1 hypothetical protein AnaeK_1543 [Anaeromyxobacter sp. K]
MSDEAGLAGGESTYWIEDDGSGVCPHCGVPVQYADYTWHYHPKGSVHPPPFVKKGLTQHDQRIDVATCTKCGKHVADWVSYRQAGIEGGGGRNTLPMPVYEVVQRVGAYPGSRAPKVEPEVPPDLARDYREAVGVAHISTRAAAALARRGLQAALRGCGFKAPSRKVNDEIGLALADGRTSALLAEKLRFVQGVGNDAVHPNLAADGDLIEVTPEDVTVIIAALDEFFDGFFVKPARHAAIMKARAERKKGTGGGTT